VKFQILALSVPERRGPAAITFLAINVYVGEEGLTEGMNFPMMSKLAKVYIPDDIYPGCACKYRCM
jgi:hypothetical protein